MSISDDASKSEVPKTPESHLQSIGAAQVRSLMSMTDCIDAVAMAMKATSTGRIVIPRRIIMELIDDSACLAVMPGSSAEPFVYGCKIVSLHPSNPDRGLPAVQGFVLLFDHATGAPIALVDGATITAMRTAAASALATRELARADSRTLGILGCGVQAASHLEAICAVRPIERVLVWGRSFDKAQAFTTQQAAAALPPLRAIQTAQQAAACDVVCVVTGSHNPVIRGEWVRPGSHVNLVGAHSATTREADSALIAKARVYVDSRESAATEAGDLLIPLAERAISADHVVGELGELLLTRIPGRTGNEEITVYKSLGIVAQDLFAAKRVLDRFLGVSCDGQSVAVPAI